GKLNGPLGFHALFSGQATGTALGRTSPNWDEILPVPNQPAPPNTVPLLDLDLHLYHLGVDAPVDYDVYKSFAEALSLTSIRTPGEIATGAEVAQAHVGASSQAVTSMSRPSADYVAAPTPSQRGLSTKPFSVHILPAALRASASDIGSHLSADQSQTSDFQIPGELAAFVQTSLQHLQCSGIVPGIARERAPMVCHDHLDHVQFMPDPIQVLLCVNPPQEVSEVKIYYSGQCERLTWIHGDVIILHAPCKVEASLVRCISVMVDSRGELVAQ
ncbi:unnamed protein product, partial [Clonostachys rhizophaga]